LEFVVFRGCRNDGEDGWGGLFIYWVKSKIRHSWQLTNFPQTFYCCPFVTVACHGNNRDYTVTLNSQIFLFYISFTTVRMSNPPPIFPLLTTDFDLYSSNFYYFPPSPFQKFRTLRNYPLIPSLRMCLVAFIFRLQF